MPQTDKPLDAANPVTNAGMRLVILMYDGAIGALNKALAAIEAGDLQARCDAVNMTMDILTQLCLALDFEQGGAVAGNLGDLYLSMITRLVRTNMLNDPQPAREVLQMLEPLYNAWRTLDERITEEAVAHRLTSAPQPLRAVG